MSFCDTGDPHKKAPTWKSLISNYFHAASNVACRVLSMGGELHMGPNHSESRMKKDRKETASSEPMGIIISRGDKTEPTPVFSAYIWGPVPDAATDSATRAA